MPTSEVEHKPMHEGTTETTTPAADQLQTPDAVAEKPLPLSGLATRSGPPGEATGGSGSGAPALTALRRRAAATPLVTGRAVSGAPEIRRWFGSKWFTKKKSPAQELADQAAALATQPKVAPATTGGGRARSNAVTGTAPGGPAPAVTAPPETAATPAVTTPAVTTPADATPADATPAATTPAVATPAVATPADATPAVTTPADATPAVATPAQPAAPVVASPTDAAPGKSAKDAFTEAIKGKAPANPDEAKTRMTELRAMLKEMSASERESISTDKALMAQARTFVGSFEYMSLVTAVGMSAKTPAKPGEAPKPQHLSGAQADTFIQAEMGKIAHLKGYMDTAVGQGKKADGFVAVVDNEDWKLIYKQQNNKDADVAGLNTNAFIANTHPDRPAIIHEDRGTPSTAIHESMHRYSVLNVLHTYGSPLNEGMTEFFTRKITDRDGKPLNGKKSNRDNYQSNYDFISKVLLPLLGDGDETAAETTLAEIYFSGKTDLIESKFTAACTAAKMDKKATAALWKEFFAALKGGEWAKAKTNLPPAP